jgi:nitrite reductase/ring-hydroxylating ferredoxin subunit
MDSHQRVEDVYAVCRADFVANQRCRSFALLRVGDDGNPVPWQVLILRWGQNFYGYVNRCPHQKSPLNFERDQFFDPDRRFLMCGKHGALFDITTGICVDGSCRGEALERISVLEVDGDLCVSGMRLVEDDGADDADETMEIMIHPD